MTKLNKLLQYCNENERKRFIKKIKFPYTKNKKISMKKCWIWNGNISKKVPIFWFNGTTTTAARAVYQMTCNKKPNICYHTCGNYKCVNPNHIKNGTKSESIHNAIKLGKYFNTDGTFKHSILTRDQLILIHKLVDTGLKCIDISKKLNIKYHLIHNVLYNNCNGHIDLKKSGK